jgi:hypothetical protein
MDERAHTLNDQELPPVSNAEMAIRHFQAELASGKHWYLALLESIGLWTDETEIVDGRGYQYLIEGEAFDWLLLAERLCDTVEGLVPDQPKNDLLFHGKPPLPLEADQYKNLMGEAKYHKYLNFFYGVTVEEALVQAIREEVRKERRLNFWNSNMGEEEEVFSRVYDEPYSTLLKQFRKEKHYHLLSNSNLTERKQFTYWCFKHRLKTCEKARVASDTQKGLMWLNKNEYS